MIGIRLADGSYYPVYDENQNARKRLVLSPANDNQQAVHVQFYRDDSEMFLNPEFLGSVDLENLSPGNKNDKNISLFVSLNEEEKLEVTARDDESGHERQLVLETKGGGLASANLFSDEEFSLEDDIDLPEPSDFIGDQEDLAALQEEAAANGGMLSSSLPNTSDFSALTDDDDENDEFWDEEMGNDYELSEPEGLKPGMLAAFVLLATSATLALSFLMYTIMQGSDVPPINSMLEHVQTNLAFWTAHFGSFPV